MTPSLLAWGVVLAIADAINGRWSPYLVGIGIGVLTCLAMLICGRRFGASGGYATTAGLVSKTVAREHTERLPWFKKHTPRLNWGVMLLGGLILGAFVAAWTGGTFTNRFLPPLWQRQFGEDSHVLRGSVALAGGILMALGAQLAGGCTSGHGISGTMQLAASSWIKVACFFVGGVATAFLLYRW